MKYDNVSRSRDIIIGFNNWKQYANNLYPLCYTSTHDESNDATYLELNLSALMERCKLEELHSLLSSFLTHNRGTVPRYPFTQDANIIMVLFFMSLATVGKPFKNIAGFLCAFFKIPRELLKGKYICIYEYSQLFYL